MPEGKEEIITQIKKKIRMVVEEVIENMNLKTIINTIAVAGFAIGSFLIGAGVTYYSAITSITGTGFVILGIARLIHNKGGFR